PLWPPNGNVLANPPYVNPQVSGARSDGAIEVGCHSAEKECMMYLHNERNHAFLWASGRERQTRLARRVGCSSVRGLPDSQTCVRASVFRRASVFFSNRDHG